MAGKKKSSPVSDALLEAHIAFLVDQLTGSGFQPFVEEVLDAVLAQAATVKLETVISRKTIKDVARQYALEMEYGGGIPELVGDVARAIHAAPEHQQTQLGQLLSKRRYDELVEHLLSLRSVRERFLKGFVESAIYEQIASDLLYNGIRGYVASAEAPGFIPGARSALKLGRAVVRRATANIEDVVEESIKHHIGRSIREVSQRTVQPLIDGEHDAAIRQGAAETWAQARMLRVGSLADELSATDLEELFVTLYECWKDLRKTKYLGALVDVGVDAFFDKYGAIDLAALLDDLSIDHQLMLGEAMRFGPPVLSELAQGGQLQAVLRTALQPFYQSGMIDQVLARQG